MSETIINGIDVSECEYFKQNRGFDCYKGRNCTETNDCYFKQFKRLEQKNKCLKEEIEFITDKKVMTFSCFKYIKEHQEKLEQSNEAYKQSEQEAKEIIAELKHKNKRLQEENEGLKEKNAILILANSGIEEKNEQLNERVKTFTKPRYYYKGLQKTEEEKDKYKQALEEIRNITDKLIIELPEYNSCYYKDECGDNCTPKKQSKVQYCCYENVDKILTIINEVIK